MTQSTPAMRAEELAKAFYKFYSLYIEMDDEQTLSNLNNESEDAFNAADESDYLAYDSLREQSVAAYNAMRRFQAIRPLLANMQKEVDNMKHYIRKYEDIRNF